MPAKHNFQNLHLVDHPLVQHKLSFMRRKETSSADFRRLLREISMLMAYEVTRNYPLTTRKIETPICTFDAPVLAGKKMALVSILRAGTGILDGMLELIPSARVGHIGLYRDPKTLEAVEYYCKLPEDLEHRDTVVVDPMLATGHSAAAALKIISQFHPRSFNFVCLVAAPEGVSLLQDEFPEIPIFAAALDERLNEHGYIVPGLGDAGDRLFGTK